jgi:multiple sugar transport system ATP-binding protein
VLRVHKEIGAATLYVTHDQVEAMTMGDRVAVLLDGVLQQYGTPRELYDRPANVFVATFIGSPEINLYEASLDASGGLVLGSQRLPVPRPAGLAAYQGRKVIVGIRPEGLTAGASGEAVSGEAPLAADVRMVEPLGSELHVFFSVDAPAASGGTLAAAAGESAADTGLLTGQRYNGIARLDPRSGVRAGSRVTFGVDTSRLRFFDPDTGLAIG